MPLTPAEQKKLEAFVCRLYGVETIDDPEPEEEEGEDARLETPG